MSIYLGIRSMLHRDQKRLNAIGNLIQQHGLLQDDEIHSLAHDLGDIEDAAVELSKQTDKLLAALKRYETSPRECRAAFGGLWGWFEEFRMHMRSAEEVTQKVCQRIDEQHPELRADAE